ncbi:MAG TPA: GTPase [Lautropia sp.]|nr:GTPase [Lautropia sp.]
MNDQEREAIASIALLAAFSDGRKTDDEREEVRRVAETLEGELPMTALYRDVLLRKTTAETAAAFLSTREMKLLAYELAVGVADSDGLRNDEENAFLKRLARALGLDDRIAQGLQEPADALASIPLDSGAQHQSDRSAPAPFTATDPSASRADGRVDPEDQVVAGGAGGKIFIGTGDSSSEGITGSAPPPTSAPSTVAAGSADVEIDKIIINAAVMNGALELLPQSLASMAIIPLQMKLVYRIGKVHGFELDRGHVKDLLATMGVGVTGQYLEDIGRKLLGGLLGRAGGKMLGGLAGGATGVAFSFATTWAIGQVAKRYYAGGRKMDSALLKQTYTSLMDEARNLQDRYAPQIEQQAKTIDMTKIVELVKSR